MLYIKEHIDNILTCENCKIKLKLAKLLPNGQTICSDCEHSSNTVLPVNEKLMEIINKKPVCLKTFKLYEETKTKLDIIKNLIEKLKYETMENKIKTKCDFLRHEIDCAYESHCILMNSYRVDLMEKINNFESDFFSNDTIKSKFIDKYNESKQNIEKCEALHLSWSGCLISDNNTNKLSEIYNEMTNVEIYLREKCLDFEKVLFDKGQLYFHKNETVTADLLGKVNSTPLKSLKSNILHNLGRRVIKYKIKNHFRQHSIFALATKSNHLAVSVSCRIELIDGLNVDSMNLFLFNKENGQLLTSINHSWFMDCIGFSNDDSIILGHLGLTTIRFNKLDFDLKFKCDMIKHVHYSNKQKEVDFNNDEIVVKLLGTRIDTLTLLYIFDFNLQQIDLIKLSRVFKKLKLTKSFIYLHAIDSIQVLSRDTLNLLHEIRISSFDFIFDIYQESRILVANKNVKYLKLYDFNGSVIDEIHVSFINKISSVQVADNGEIAIDNQDDGVIYLN